MVSHIVGGTKFYDRTLRTCREGYELTSGRPEGVVNDGVTMKHAPYANRHRKSRESEDEVISASFELLCIIYRVDRLRSRRLAILIVSRSRVPDLITRRRSSSRATRG